MTDITDLIARGSLTAKNGFANESFIRDEFNNWQFSSLSQAWLIKMGYKLTEIEYVRAEKLSGHKTDIQVSISVIIKLNRLTDVQNIQVKLLSNKSGFNQIDKRWVNKYAELWQMTERQANIFKHYTGELPPYVPNTKDPRRMFADELSLQDRSDLLNFIKRNQFLIVSDIIKGRGEFHAEWMLVILKTSNQFAWTLKPINIVLNYFGNGDVQMTNQGNIRIGKITMQRKGGDGGRPTANMLQFKINPAKLFEF